MKSYAIEKREHEKYAYLGIYERRDKKIGKWLAKSASILQHPRYRAIKNERKGGENEFKINLYIEFFKEKV